ncbi:MAG: SpoIIE family protein phosphatase [Actinobacteria bacterium]|nr:SpoIIE family protein phosphatase [Actinomycetota bacterium]
MAARLGITRTASRWLLVGIALDAALAVADAAVGSIAGTYLVTPLLLAIFVTPALTALGAAVSIVLAALSGVWHDDLGSAWLIRLVIVVVGGALAYYAALRRERRERAARRYETLAAVADVVEASPAAFVGIDETGYIRLFNPAAEQMFGYRAREVLGSELAELIVPERLRAAHRAGLFRLRASGESRILGRRVDLPALHADGSELPVALTITRLRGEGPAAYVGFIRDISGEVEAQRRQRVLARTGELLASSIDYEQTLREIARLGVPELADWCAVDVPTAAGAVATMARASADAGAVELGPLRSRYSERARRDHTTAGVIASGHVVFEVEVGEQELAAYARDDDQLELLRELRITSLMVVPLKARRRTVGALTLATTDSRRRFSARDLELAQELAERAGMAIDNARLYAERARTATTLMASLRPPPIPELPGWDTAALYRPAGRADEVGGDFYDVFLAGRGWMLVIGDVVGHGPPAAALTSLARYSIRTAATLTGSPHAALEHLNEELRREGRLALFSAACVLLCEDDGRAQATVAVAGHPRPILVRAGEARPIGQTATILGVDDDSEYPQETLELSRGDFLVLYTDGVTDAASDGERFGEDRLLDALSAAASSAEQLLDRIRQALSDFQGRAQRDDVAILIVERLAASGNGHGPALSVEEQASALPEAPAPRERGLSS